MIYKRTTESFFILAYLIEIMKVASLPSMEALHHCRVRWPPIAGNVANLKCGINQLDGVTLYQV